MCRDRRACSRLEGLLLGLCVVFGMTICGCDSGGSSSSSSTDPSINDRETPDPDITEPEDPGETPEVTDTTPPSEPQNLQVVATSPQSAFLSWDAAEDPESGINGYEVYRDGDFIAFNSGTAYTDSGLEPVTTYAYQIQAVNGSNLATGSAVHFLTTPQLPPTPDDPVNETSAMGMNLAWIVHEPSELAFVNLFRQSEPWSGGSLDLDDQGWVQSLNPGQSARSRICSGIEGHYPAGLYTCLYDGEGELDFDRDATIVSQEPGMVILDVNPTDDGMRLWITETNPDNYIRNIRLIMPGFEDDYDTQVFHPDFLARWEHFKVFRFMNWQRTSNSPVRHWDERITPAHARYWGPGGAALETMVELSNRLNVDPWFSMHHLWTDDDIESFATLVRDTLDPGLKVYVEYSNEVWNGSFVQAQYARDQGELLGLSTNRVTAGLRFYAQRSVEIFQIWEDVFGSTDQLVRVLSVQNASPTRGITVMDWEDAHESADALAVAPYFGGALGAEDTQDEIAQWSVQEVLDYCEGSIVNVLEDSAEHSDNAADRGLFLIAYEGGQHLNTQGTAEDNVPLNQLFHDANRDPGMGDLYEDLLQQWKDLGGRTFVAFDSMRRYSNEGRWGAFEWHDQEYEDLAEAPPKYRGLMQFLLANPVWW